MCLVEGIRSNESTAATGQVIRSQNSAQRGPKPQTIFGPFFVRPKPRDLIGLLWGPAVLINGIHHAEASAEEIRPNRHGGAAGRVNRNRGFVQNGVAQGGLWDHFWSKRSKISADPKVSENVSSHSLAPFGARLSAFEHFLVGHRMTPR